MPRAVEQLSRCTRTSEPKCAITEACLPRAYAARRGKPPERHNEKPVHCSERQALLTTAGESPRAATASATKNNLKR